MYTDLQDFEFIPTGLEGVIEWKLSARTESDRFLCSDVDINDMA